MVAIKIQSREDVITAYMLNLGFQHEKLPDAVKIVAVNLPQQLQSGDEVLEFMDKAVLKMAKEIYPNSCLADEQLVAEFKLCFLLGSGADYCRPKEFTKLELPHELVQRMQEQCISTAPQYHYTEMKMQAIESANTLGQIFHHKKKASK